MIAGWQATSGRPNISAVPIAGCLTRQQGNSIQQSIPAVSAVRFAGSRSTRGLATMSSSIGTSISPSCPCLGKGGRSRQSGIARTQVEAEPAPVKSKSLSSGAKDGGNGHGQRIRTHSQGAQSRASQGMTRPQRITGNKPGGPGLGNPHSSERPARQRAFQDALVAEGCRPPRPEGPAGRTLAP